MDFLLVNFPGKPVRGRAPFLGAAAEPAACDPGGGQRPARETDRHALRFAPPARLTRFEPLTAATSPVPALVGASRVIGADLRGIAEARAALAPGASGPLPAGGSALPHRQAGRAAPAAADRGRPE